MTRDELIEAGARALEADHTNRAPGDAWQILAPMAESVLDAVEPLIRADEREQRESWAEVVSRADGTVLADLRARVSALEKRGLEMPYDSSIGHDMVWRSDVLALLDCRACNRARAQRNYWKAKVEALPGAPASGSGWIARDDVLALLDGDTP